MKWLLSIFESDGGAHLSLPPIASNDPILAWVWSSISAVQMGQVKDRVDAANQLASLARDNDRNKKMIVEEGGILPLLKMLKEGASVEAQTAAATALSNIASDGEKVRVIVDAHGISMIVEGFRGFTNEGSDFGGQLWWREWRIWMIMHRRSL
ncbi:ARMADILLO REPEAT ONLY 1 PROTEIN [Salix purpurea]|uniref:ARMADILLO REPEAT ONLY 1 PROTEIN n=1 Tax=Salix purpurea TaxID=77065 RepID=A0A9Q0W7S6_SALPP|nr:ARMADILLO REPEAT ONLY 1 PROTEIN [Salix purpurea]